MQPTPTEEQLALAAWYVQHKRRWPLGFLLAMGLLSAVTSLIFGLGVAAARANVPKSTAAAEALARPDPPKGQNAAPFWDAAVGACATWPGPAGTDPMRDTGIEWNDDDTYAPNGPLRAYLSANARALALCDQAAAFPHADWNPEFRDGMGMRIPFLAKQRMLARLNRVRARVAAYDNDWNQVLAALHTARKAGMHASEDPILISHLVGIAINAITVETIEEVLNTPNARPDAATIDRLLAFARDSIKSEAPISAALEGERVYCLMMTDQLVSGTLGAAGSSFAPASKFAPQFNPIGFIYLTDRAAMTELFDQYIAHAVAIETDGKAVLGEDAYGSNVASDGRLEHLFTNMLVPINARMCKSFLQRRARWRTAIAGLLAYRHALAHGGAWPKRLEQLLTDNNEGLDPCGKEPHGLHRRVEPDGTLVIWSVGTNGVDDGGPIEEDTSGDDEVFAVHPLPGSENAEAAP